MDSALPVETAGRLDIAARDKWRRPEAGHPALVAPDLVARDRVGTALPVAAHIPASTVAELTRATGVRAARPAADRPEARIPVAGLLQEAVAADRATNCRVEVDSQDLEVWSRHGLSKCRESATVARSISDANDVRSQTRNAVRSETRNAMARNR